MTRRRNRSALHGFTLIELMVTLAVAAILMVIAAPSFMAFQRNSELTSAVNSLIAATAAARGEAMKTGMQAVVVPTDGTNWNSGWLVFVDKGRDRIFTAGTDISVLTQAALPSYFSVSANGTGDATPPYILFDASGYPKTKNGAFGALTISIARNDLGGSAALPETRSVIISAAGRVRSCRPVSAPDAKCPVSTDPAE